MFCSFKKIKFMNYFVSGVWKTTQGVVTHVMLHLVSGGHPVINFMPGEKATLASVCRLIELGHTVNCVMWPYTGKLWDVGPQVTVINGLNGDFLRSVADNTIKDNLDNLINYTALF